MTLTWHTLATAGAPPKISALVSMDVKRRKLYSQPPTADGAVPPPTPAAPVAPVAPVAPRTPAASAAPVVAVAPVAPVATRAPVSQPPPQFQGMSLESVLPQLAGMLPQTMQALQSLPGFPAFTFPGAVNILNSAPTSAVHSQLTASSDKENQPINLADDDDELDEYDFDGDDEYQYEKMCELAMKTDCDAMRRKIQRFLARKTMTQTAFLRKIECNSNSYRKFMSYKGKDKGINNQCYDGALVFFARLEKEEGKSVGNKRASKPKGADKEAAGTGKVSRKDQQAQTQEFLDKINAVQLQEPVYVFDDCDDIRKKINEMIESKKLTQAALLRAMDVNSNSLRRFLTTKGKREGCSNGVYYSAYCFFEKLRIAQGIAKTNKRLKNEREMPTGYSLKRDPTHFWVFTGERF